MKKILFSLTLCSVLFISACGSENTADGSMKDSSSVDSTAADTTGRQAIPSNTKVTSSVDKSGINASPNN
ncbi:hypothetical protein [Pedobacter sp. BAL39]|uniref:hypothetical protein n=1 Tax=Pedobacter sp. BAL39 TaxID=391596 RepID=UPI0012F84C80|nr:hypothetical protein [Pedobacter sp. BAL39]